MLKMIRTASLICKSTRNPILATQTNRTVYRGSFKPRFGAKIGPASRSTQQRTLPDKKALACPLVSVLPFWHQPKF